MDLNLRFQTNLVAVQTATELHLMIEVTTPAPPTDAERQPLRVGVVLDRSGSMAGDRLETAKLATKYLAAQLAPEDMLALVTYDSVVELLAALGPVTAATTHAIDAIQVRGSTNLSGGWLKGVEELRRQSDGIRRVLLLSDGHANVGIMAPDQLRQLAETIAAEGISTTTIGIGDGFDEVLMTAMADAGRGSAHFAATPDDAPGIFAEEFDNLVSLVAQNLSVEVRPTDDVQVVGVLNDFPTTLVPGGVQVQVGDAFGGQTLRVVLKLGIPKLAGLGLATVGEVVIRWVGLGDQVTEHTVTQKLVVNAVSADEAATATPDPGVIEEVTVLLAGRATGEARQRAERGDIEGARKIVEATIATLDEAAASHPAAERLRETIARLEATASRMHGEALRPAVAKALHYEERTLRNRKRDR